MEHKQIVASLRALSNDTRLAMMMLLMEGKHCNCELSEDLDISLSLTSHHLNVLRQSGLVDAERAPVDARWIYYSVNPTQLHELLVTLNHLLNPAQLQDRSPRCGRSAHSHRSQL